MGSWWPAQIISGNGRLYHVRYEYDQCYRDKCTAVERVPRKAIRPSPPLMADPLDLASGDILEVFDNGSWKLAEMTRVVDGHHYFVRLLDCCEEFEAQRCNLRLRQLWHDDQWILIPKVTSLLSILICFPHTVREWFFFPIVSLFSAYIFRLYRLRNICGAAPYLMLSIHHIFSIATTEKEVNFKQRKRGCNSLQGWDCSV